VASEATRPRLIPEQQWLSALNKGEVVQELLLTTFLMFTRVPPPGIRLNLDFGGHHVDFFRPPMTAALPTVDSDCFKHLFRSLSVSNIVFILSSLLQEQRVLLHSTNMERLCGVCEALTSLLFPLVWAHALVPVLPLQMLQFLQAPCPYVMGLHTDFLETQEGMDALVTSVIVHLDVDKVVTPMEIELPGGLQVDVVPELPHVLRARLLTEVAAAIPPRNELVTAATAVEAQHRVLGAPLRDATVTADDLLHVGHALLMPQDTQAVSSYSSNLRLQKKEPPLPGLYLQRFLPQPDSPRLRVDTNAAVEEMLADDFGGAASKPAAPGPPDGSQGVLPPPARSAVPPLVSRFDEPWVVQVRASFASAMGAMLAGYRSYLVVSVDLPQEVIAALPPALIDAPRRFRWAGEPTVNAGAAQPMGGGVSGLGIGRDKRQAELVAQQATNAGTGSLMNKMKTMFAWGNKNKAATGTDAADMTAHAPSTPSSTAASGFSFGGWGRSSVTSPSSGGDAQPTRDSARSVLSEAQAEAEHAAARNAATVKWIKSRAGSAWVLPDGDSHAGDDHDSLFVAALTDEDLPVTLFGSSPAEFLAATAAGKQQETLPEASGSSDGSAQSQADVPSMQPLVVPPITFRVEFHKAAFLQSRPIAWRGFMDTMLNTQAISSFLEDAALTGRLLEAAQVATTTACVAGGASVQVPVEGAFPTAHVTAAMAQFAPLHLVTAAPFVQETVSKSPTKSRPPSQSNVSVSSDAAPAPLLRGFRPFARNSQAGTPQAGSGHTADGSAAEPAVSPSKLPSSPKPVTSPTSSTAFDGVSGSVARTPGGDLGTHTSRTPGGAEHSGAVESPAVDGGEWGALWACLSDAEVVQDTVLCHLPPIPLPPALRSSWWEQEFKQAREAALQAADSGAKATASASSDSIRQAAVQAQEAERDEEAILARQQGQYDALGVSAEDAAEIRLFDWLCAVQLIHSGSSAGFLPKWPGMHSAELVPATAGSRGSDSNSDSSDSDEDSEASSSDEDDGSSSGSAAAGTRRGVSFAAPAALAAAADSDSCAVQADDSVQRSDSGMDSSTGTAADIEEDLYSRRRGASLSRRAASQAKRSGTLGMREFFNSPKSTNHGSAIPGKHRSVSLSFRGKQPAAPARPSPPGSPASRPMAPVLLPADVLSSAAALLTRKPVQLASMGAVSPANSVANLLLCGRQDCVPPGHKAVPGMSLDTAQERVLDIEEAAADLHALWRGPVEQMLAQHDAMHGAGGHLDVPPQKDHISLPPLRYGLLSAMQVLAVTTDMSAPASSASSVCDAGDAAADEAGAEPAGEAARVAVETKQQGSTTGTPSASRAQSVHARGALHRASMTWAHGSTGGLALARAATDGVLLGRFDDAVVPPPTSLDAIMAAEAARSRSHRTRVESSASSDTGFGGSTNSSGRTPRAAQGTVAGLGTARRMRMRRSSMALELSDIGLLVSKPEHHSALPTLRQRGGSVGSSSSQPSAGDAEQASPSLDATSMESGDAVPVPILQRRGTAGRRNRRLGSIAVTGLDASHLHSLSRSDSVMSSTDWTRHSTSSSYITPAVASEAASRAAALTAQLSGQSMEQVEETGTDSDSTAEVPKPPPATQSSPTLQRGNSMRMRGRRGSISVMSHALLMAAHKPAETSSVATAAAAARARHTYSMSTPVGPISPLRETSDDSNDSPRHFSVSDDDDDDDDDDAGGSRQGGSPESGRLSPQGIVAEEGDLAQRMALQGVYSSIADAEAARGDLDSPRYSTWSVASSISYAPPGIAGRDSLEPSEAAELSQEALESTLLVKNLDTGELAHVGAVLTPVEQSLAAIRERSASASPSSDAEAAASQAAHSSWWNKVTSRVVSLTKPKGGAAAAASAAHVGDGADTAAAGATMATATIEEHSDDSTGSAGAGVSTAPSPAPPKPDTANAPPAREAAHAPEAAAE